MSLLPMDTVPPLGCGMEVLLLDFGDAYTAHADITLDYAC